MVNFYRGIGTGLTVWAPNERAAALRSHSMWHPQAITDYGSLPKYATALEHLQHSESSTACSLRTVGGLQT